MASRTFDTKPLSIQKRRVWINAVIAIPSGTTPVLQKYVYGTLGVGGQTYTAAATTGGGSGFPSRYAQGFEGVYSVARTDVGLWTLTLQDNYQRILRVAGAMGVAGGAANIIAVTENSTITNMNATGGSVIGIALMSATATLADPTAAATAIVRIELTLQDASEP